MNPRAPFVYISNADICYSVDPFFCSAMLGVSSRNPHTLGIGYFYGPRSMFSFVVAILVIIASAGGERVHSLCWSHGSCCSHEWCKALHRSLQPRSAASCSMTPALAQACLLSYQLHHIGALVRSFKVVIMRSANRHQHRCPCLAAGAAAALCSANRRAVVHNHMDSACKSSCQQAAA